MRDYEKRFGLQIKRIITKISFIFDDNNLDIDGTDIHNINDTDNWAYDDR